MTPTEPVTATRPAFAPAAGEGQGCAIAVMAKAPRAGRVKTRLSPPLLPGQAAAMSAAFLRDITENMRLAAAGVPIRGCVAFAPQGDESLFDGVLAEETVLVLADGAIEAPPDVRGFGLALLHAARSLFAQGHAAVCLLNADSPTLPTALLVQLAQALAPPGDRVVLGPAEDGGYWVIGLKAAHARLFGDIAWSTGLVAEQTRARAAELGLPLVELAPWFDVDDASALARMLAGRSEHGFEPYPAPATRALAARLGMAVDRHGTLVL